MGGSPISAARSGLLLARRSIRGLRSSEFVMERIADQRGEE